MSNTELQQSPMTVTTVVLLVLILFLALFLWQSRRAVKQCRKNVFMRQDEIKTDTIGRRWLSDDKVSSLIGRMRESQSKPLGLTETIAVVRGARAAVDAVLQHVEKTAGRETYKADKIYL